jgi:hypothetical protein
MNQDNQSNNAPGRRDFLKGIGCNRWRGLNRFSISNESRCLDIEYRPH